VTCKQQPCSQAQRAGCVRGIQVEKHIREDVLSSTDKLGEALASLVKRQEDVISLLSSITNQADRHICKHECGTQMSPSHFSDIRSREVTLIADHSITRSAVNTSKMGVHIQSDKPGPGNSAHIYAAARSETSQGPVNKLGKCHDIAKPSHLPLSWSRDRPASSQSRKQTQVGWLCLHALSHCR
jgi:hypothetical protein